MILLKRREREKKGPQLEKRVHYSYSFEEKAKGREKERYLCKPPGELTKKKRKDGNDTTVFDGGKGRLGANFLQLHV